MAVVISLTNLVTYIGRVILDLGIFLAGSMIDGLEWELSGEC